MSGDEGVSGCCLQLADGLDAGAAAGLLVVLQDGGEHARGGKAAAVERVDEARLLLPLGAMPDVGAARTDIRVRFMGYILTSRCPILRYHTR